MNRSKPIRRIEAAAEPKQCGIYGTLMNFHIIDRILYMAETEKKGKKKIEEQVIL